MKEETDGIGICYLMLKFTAKLTKVTKSIFTGIPWSVNSNLSEQSYNPDAYEELMEFLSRHSLNDGDKFCADLMRESPRHKGLGMPTINLHLVFVGIS